MDTLQDTFKIINEFLKLCNLDSLKFDDADVSSDLDVLEVVKNLSDGLNEIVSKSERPEEQNESAAQITVSHQEMNQRIQAFMKYSQNKVDEQNVKEFCSPSQSQGESGCARTDSCYRRRSCQTTHMEVTKVKNLDGPQMNFATCSDWISHERDIPLHKRELPKPLAERLNNIESHLQVQSEPYMDVYTRLRNLENRLLALEGLSPEYQSMKLSTPENMTLKRHNFRNGSLQDIDDRVRHLKQVLLAKKRRLDQESLLS